MSRTPANPSKAADRKAVTLQRQGSLHPHPEQVTDPLFGGSDFFDTRDLVQVKYEMLRRVRVDGKPVAESAAAFGLSRPSFYQAQTGFERDGLGGLIRKKPGPRRSHKVSDDVVEFVESLLAQDPSLPTRTLALRVKERFRRSVHPRSIERALVRQKKKRLR
jgi:transposase